MPSRKHTFLIPIALGILLLAGLIFLWPATQANAQCGSQASSCKNCHEVQGQDPVNNDGTGWHQSHAFGDFCYICHGGNNQSMDKDTAHTGMVPPLSDVKAACQSCHPNDLMERAKVYATALGVEVGTGGGSSSGGDGATSGGNASGGSDTSGGEAPAGGSSATGESSGASSAPASAPGMVVEQPEVIDYNQLYEGKRPVNWGNILLALMTGMVAVGGGSYVFVNERKLHGRPIRWAAKPAKATAASALPNIEGYTPEVVALLPRLAQLNPVGLHALQRLLENPEEASDLLHSLSHLDPELVRQVRSLDREARAILLALAGGE